MIVTRALPLLLAAMGVSAQRWRGGGNRNTPAPQPTVPPPPRGSTQTLWGQCGGREWEYATACPRDASCYNDGNEWYSQCIPAQEAREKSEKDDDDDDYPRFDDTIETRVITTIFDVPGPTPTTVTTYITIFTPSPTPTPREPVYITLTAVPDEPWNGD